MQKIIYERAEKLKNSNSTGEEYKISLVQPFIMFLLKNSIEDKKLNYEILRAYSVEICTDLVRYPLKWKKK